MLNALSERSLSRRSSGAAHDPCGVGIPPRHHVDGIDLGHAFNRSVGVAVAHAAGGNVDPAVVHDDAVIGMKELAVDGKTAGQGLIFTTVRNAADFAGPTDIECAAIPDPGRLYALTR